MPLLAEQPSSLGSIKKALMKFKSHQHFQSTKIFKIFLKRSSGSLRVSSDENIKQFHFIFLTFNEREKGKLEKNCIICDIKSKYAAICVWSVRREEKIPTEKAERNFQFPFFPCALVFLTIIRFSLIFI